MTTDEVRAGVPRVTLADGDEASGLASMLAGLLADNLRDFPVRGRVAAMTRGDVVLTASDRDVSVTLSFRPGEVLVSNGASDGAPELAGPWLDMAKLCSGQRSPVAALAHREVRLVPRPGLQPKNLAAVPAVSFVLSVPASFYGDNDQQRRRLLVAAGAGVAVVGIAVAVRRRRARR